MSQEIVNTDKLISQCQKVWYAWRDDSVGRILTSQKVHLCPYVQDPFKAGYSNLCMYNTRVPLRRLEAERREFPEAPVPVKVSIRQWNPVLKNVEREERLSSDLHRYMCMTTSTHEHTHNMCTLTRVHTHIHTHTSYHIHAHTSHHTHTFNTVSPLIKVGHPWVLENSAADWYSSFLSGPMWAHH